jgi:hopanoid biosynthesis associated protein HpnK
VKRLIVTGDDFGLAVPVNEAIEDAHRSGILTAASLMVGAPAAADAVARARRLPSLRVGLHVVLVEGRPVSPPASIPHLVGAAGELETRLFRAGVRFFFHPAARRELAREIRAQFEAFRATGLALDHANAHNHMHLHPTVMGLLLEIGRDYGLPAVRVPREPPLVTWRAARAGLFGRVLGSAFLAPWTALLRRKAARAGLSANDHVLGLHDSGRMNEALVERLVAGLPEGTTEMYFHAATRRCPELDRHMADYHHEDELRALKSPRVRAALEAAGVERVAFSRPPVQGRAERAD